MTVAVPNEVEPLRREDPRMKALVKRYRVAVDLLRYTETNEDRVALLAAAVMPDESAYSE